MNVFATTTAHINDTYLHIIARGTHDGIPDIGEVGKCKHVYCGGIAMVRANLVDRTLA